MVSGRTWTAAGALLAVVVGFWAGFSAQGHRASRAAGGGGAVGVRVPAGEASPPTANDTAQGGVDVSGDVALALPHKIPERLPDFSLGDRSGRPTSIATWRGKSLIINFWATWCAPCRREIPLLQALSVEWAGRDVAVVGVAVDHPEQVVAYANELKIAYPLLIGEQDALDVAATFGMDSPAFPFTVFTDRHGDVVALYLGELHRVQADMILSTIQRLNQDQVRLRDARRSIADALHALATGRAG